MSNAAEKVEPMQDIKERPILFSAPMVRAILEGRKTQTRRIVKPQPAGEWAAPGKTACPYGRPGERLWVRETWSRAKLYPASHELFYRADGECNGRQLSLSYIEREGRWRPSIHMPRWASRIDLEITAVRVERLQEISVGDCCEEGAPIYDGDEGQTHAVQTWYRELWEQINGPGSWDLNPWVWVIEFKKI